MSLWRMRGIVGSRTVEPCVPSQRMRLRCVARPVTLSWVRH